MKYIKRTLLPSIIINMSLLKDEIFKGNIKHFKLQITKEKMKKRYKEKIFSKPVYAKLSKKEKETLEKATDILKQENEELYEFYETLSENTNEENLRRFLYNIKTLTIKERIKKLITPSFYKNQGLASYQIWTNSITLYIKKKSVLFHELLHMSSSDKSSLTCGFLKTFDEGKGIEPEEIGRGLDEGYTETQNNRLFKHKSFGYIKLQKLTRLIELFFDNKEEMKKYYLNGDLDGIFYELNKYMSIDEIIEILIDMDELAEQSSLKYIKYIKLKKKLIDIYSREKTKEETKIFKKEARKNQVVKILTNRV